MSKSERLTLLNTSILTAFGEYRYEPVSLERVKEMLRESGRAQQLVQSAIGHQATAELMAVLLDYPVTMNRMEFRQSVDDVGLVFKLKGRAPEGVVLSRAEIEAMGYEFGLLTRLS